MRLFQRTILSSLSLTMACVAFVSSAHAASGTIIIEQQSPTANNGSWILTRPSGQTVLGNSREELVTQTNSGTYIFVITPPTSAITHIETYDNGILTNTVQGTHTSFIFQEGRNVRVVVKYTFNGTVSVQSVPRGARFELRGTSGNRYTGVTPAKFDGMPPLNYMVTFAGMEGCTPPRPQSRALGANETFEFVGMYKCGTQTTPTPPTTPTPVVAPTPTPSPVVSQEVRAVTLSQELSATEAVASAIVKITLRVRNSGDAAVNNVNVLSLFDPSMVTIQGSTQGGVLNDQNVAWHIDTLAAGAQWSAVLTARIRQEVVAGNNIPFTMQADGADLTVAPVPSTTTVAVASLPETGAAYDLLVLGAASLLSFMLTYQVRGKRIRMSL